MGGGAVGKGSRVAGETAKPPRRGSPSPAQPRGCPLPPPGFLKPRPGKVLLIRTGHGNLPLPQPHRDIPQHPPNLGCGPPGPSSFYPWGSTPRQALESGSNLLSHPCQGSQARQSLASPQKAFAKRKHRPQVLIDIQTEKQA